MKVRLNPTRHLSVACIFSLIAGCGGQPSRVEAPVADTVASNNYFVGEQPVFGHLVNNKDGSWVFKTITASDEPSDTAYLVRLNDLTPAFDTRVAECVPQVYPASHRCNPANPFRDEDSGMLDKIINGSIAIGTAGQITDISYAYETTFDEADFNRAVDEALLNTGLDRHRLISVVTTYEAERRSAAAELAAAAEQAEAARSAAPSVTLEIQPNMSGLVAYYEGDIDFRQLIDLEPRDDGPALSGQIEADPVLPCQARQCVSAAENALASLRFNVQQNKEHIAAGMRPRSRTYRVHCNMVGYGPYRLAAQCPEEIQVTDESPVVLPIDVAILSRDFDGLYPELDIDDPNLTVRIDGHQLTYVNATDEYLTITAHTVYYNSQVHTTALPIDIPPGIAVTRDMREFVSQAIDIESTYSQMTPDKAAGASFKFGYAVRYRLASQPDERTLHDVHTFNVGCVISNRMRPGSCRAESVADNSGSLPAADLPPRQPGPM
jgi:hypothetical protein